ncbi:MAG: toxin-antitoxin system YwqK family antitoxin [Bacteroidota bacterium]
MKTILICLTALFFAFSFQSKAQTQSSDGKLPDTVNRTDSFGNKVGYWIEKQGEISYKGEYVANKKVNSWVGYYPSLFIYKVDVYVNGIKDGVSIQFDRHGKATLIENYKNGVLNGQSINYGSYNETPMAVTEFSNGKRNGQYRLYYDNAKIQEESTFKNDLKDGLSRWNSKSGKKLAEYNYKMGNFDGIQKTFYENDTLQSETKYVDNKLAGESKEYYRNGKVKESGNYVNGLKDGPWTEYDELGKVVKVTKYKEGVDVKKK